MLSLFWVGLYSHLRAWQGATAPTEKGVKNTPFLAAPTAVSKNQAKSKRSRFITLVQAATKSPMNFSLASALA